MPDLDEVWNDPAVRTFVRDRLKQAGSLRFGSDREVGTSSNAMVDYSLGGSFPDKASFPHDADDLAACVRAFDVAPAVLHPRMFEVLETYRAHLGAPSGIPSTPHRAGIPVADFASMCDDAAKAGSDELAKG